MRHLITGGAGFVGSHLADELISRGESVHVLDDLSTGEIDNLRHLRGRERFSYTIGSAEDMGSLAELVDEADVIFHLAATVGVARVVASPAQTIATNVHCTEAVLAQAARGRKPVFVASTSEVYGKSASIPFREDGDLVMGATSKGRWSYACSKALDEFLALAYHHEHGVPVVLGRLFNTVGPRQVAHHGMVLPRFAEAALRSEPLMVHGDGLQRRCFTHVSDVVTAIADLMLSGGHYGEVFNIGATQETTIGELAHRVRVASGSDSPIQYVPYEEAYKRGFEDMARRVPDTTKIHRAIGWKPRRDLAQIIEDVVSDRAAALAHHLSAATKPASAAAAPAGGSVASLGI